VLLDAIELQQLATVALNLSVALAVGSGLSSAWLRRASSSWAGDMRRWLRGAALAAFALALPADIAVLWLQGAAMAEVPLAQAAAATQALLAGTHYGAAWIAGFVALLLAAAVAVTARSTHWTLAALAGFLYTRSIVSHAGADGDISLQAAADWLHLVLISVWLGEVLVAALGTLRRPATGPAGRIEQAGYVEALSHSATVALGGIALTGLYAAWRALGSLDNPANLVGTPYGATLAIKLALVSAASLLGGANRFVVMPGLLAGLRGSGAGAAPAGRRFARVLQIEALVLVAVLIAAAVLSSTGQPGAA
jgi:putative copper resistance protein D